MSGETRQLGLFQAISLVTGNLVGSGVFLLPTTLALFGPATTLAAWLLTGIGALMLAWIFSILGRSMPENGGPHTFVTKAFGKQAGFWVAWAYWVLSWISNAALIVGAVSYFSGLTGGLSSTQIIALELSILFGIMGIHLYGIRSAGKLELVLTILKLLPLVAIPLIGLFYVDWSNFLIHLQQNSTTITSEPLFKAMYLTLWAFIGIETATVASGEVKNPSFTIGCATIVGSSLAFLVYVLGAITLFALVGAEQLATSSSPYADLANQLFGGNWAALIMICAFLCCLGSFNGWTLVVARIAQGAANQGLFPRIFARTNAKGTPWISIVISSLCTLPLLFLSHQSDLIQQFNAIIDISITLILIVYAVSVCAYVKLFCGSLRTWHIAIILGASAYIGFSLWASGGKMIFLSCLLLLLGIPFWLRQRKSLTEPAIGKMVTA